MSNTEVRGGLSNSVGENVLRLDGSSVMPVKTGNHLCPEFTAINLDSLA
jgi:hypothetical protein